MQEKIYDSVQPRPPNDENPVTTTLKNATPANKNTPVHLNQCPPYTHVIFELL